MGIGTGLSNLYPEIYVSKIECPVLFMAGVTRNRLKSKNLKNYSLPAAHNVKNFTYLVEGNTNIFWLDTQKNMSWF